MKVSLDSSFAALSSLSSLSSWSGLRFEFADGWGTFSHDRDEVWRHVGRGREGNQSRRRYREGPPSRPASGGCERYGPDHGPVVIDGPRRRRWGPQRPR